MDFRELVKQGRTQDVLDRLKAEPQLAEAVFNDDDALLVHMTAHLGHCELVERLLEVLPEQLDAKDRKQQTPLHYAASAGHVKVIKLLVRLGSRSINETCDIEFLEDTTLHLAARSGNPAAVEALVQLGCVHLDTPNFFEESPFYLAVGEGHHTVAKTILRLGSQALNTPADINLTPLHAAVRNNDEPFVRFLLEEGAIPGARVFYEATRKGNVMIASLLLEKMKRPPHLLDSGDGTPLHAAAREGHAEMVEFLASTCGLDIDAYANSTMATPLFLAVQAGSLSTVLVLLRLGSKALDKKCAVYTFTIEGWTIRPTFNFTPTTYALHHHDDDAQLLRFLLSLGGALKVDRPLTAAEVKMFPDDISEDERAANRFNVYFSESLIVRCLRENHRRYFGQSTIKRIN